jgi:hypothetical protein
MTWVVLLQSRAFGLLGIGSHFDDVVGAAALQIAAAMPKERVLLPKYFLLTGWLTMSQKETFIFQPLIIICE